MFFGFGLSNKTVRELRKNQGFTAKELAQALKIDTIEILHVDNLKLKQVPEPLKSMISPILRGKHLDQVPW